MDEKIEPKAKKRTGWIPRTIWTIVVLFFVLLFFDWVILEALSRLFFGWLALLRENFNEITIVPHRVVSALIMASLALAGLQFLALCWRRWARPDGTPWRWAWSISISAILFSAAVAAMAVAGVAHQIAWLKGEPKIEMRSKSHAGIVNNARHLGLLAIDYASEHNQQFPDDLVNLVKADLGDGYQPWMSDLFFFQESSHSTPEPWLYYGAGRFINADLPFLLLSSPRASEGNYFVVLSSGEFDILGEDDFQTLLEKLPPTTSASTLSR